MTNVLKLVKFSTILNSIQVIELLWPFLGFSGDTSVLIPKQVLTCAKIY